MAQILLNPLVDGFKGRCGGIVLVRIGDETCFRSYTTPRNPRTEAQQERRGLFADAVRSWRALDEAEKARLNSLARKGRKRTVHGYQLFIGTVLNGRTESVVTGTASFLEKNSSSAPFVKLRRSSVTAPSPLRCASDEALFPLPESLLAPGGH